MNDFVYLKSLVNSLNAHWTLFAESAATTCLWNSESWSCVTTGVPDESVGGGEVGVTPTEEHVGKLCVHEYKEKKHVIKDLDGLESLEFLRTPSYVELLNKRT